ncbi:MAG: CoA-binding protein, partial [Candidatus Bathyarchaeota archaeon]|nr:CoA-binding protein [Candidatus Bathyarchaeota archaeon]
MSSEEIKSILEKYKTIAVVGLSWNPAKESYKVAKYLKTKGYRIIPINPFAEVILGEECYKSLLDVPETIEIVVIFRSAKDVLPTVDEAIELKKKLGNPRVIWMQLGIVNEKAARRARNAGLTVLMDR